MKPEQVIEITYGMLLLSKYTKNIFHPINADHNVIMFCVDSDVSEDDTIKLNEMGWHYNEDGWWEHYV